MAANKIDLELSNQQALAAIDAVIARLKQAEDAANRLAAKAGSAGMSDPAFRTSLQEMAGAQGAASALGALQASAQAGVVPMTNSAVAQAISTGSRLGVSAIKDVPGGLSAAAQVSVAQQQAQALGGGYTPAFDSAGFTAGVMQSVGVHFSPTVPGAAVPGAAPAVPAPAVVPVPQAPAPTPAVAPSPPPTVAPAPTTPPPPPVAPPAPSTLPPDMPGTPPGPPGQGGMVGWAGMARAFGARNMMTYGGFGFAAYGISQVSSALADSYSARYGAPYRAETGMLATAASGQYQGAGTRAGILASGEIAGQIAGDRAEHGIYNWLPIGIGKWIESKVEVNRIQPMERAAAGALAMGQADDIRRHLRAMGINRRDGVVDPTLEMQYSGALTMSGFGGAARGAGAAFMSDRGMLDTWGGEAMSRALGGIAAQGMVPGNTGLRESIMRGASLYSLAPEAAMSAAARGDLGAVGAIAPTLDGRTYSRAVRTGADVLRFQGLGQGYASDVSSGSAIRSGAMLQGMSALSAGFSSMTKGIIGDQGSEIEARHNEYLTVLRARGADHPDTKAARARFNQAELGRTELLAQAYSTQLSTISGESGLRLATRGVQSTVAGLYGSDADMYESAAGRYADLGSKASSLRAKLRAARGSIPYETELAVNTEIQQTLQQQAGVRAELVSDLLARNQLRYQATSAALSTQITYQTMYGNQAGIAGAFGTQVQGMQAYISLLQGQMAGAPIGMQQQISSQISGLQQQILQSTQAGQQALANRMTLETGLGIAQTSAAARRAFRTGTAADVERTSRDQIDSIGKQITGYQEIIDDPKTSKEDRLRYQTTVEDLKSKQYDIREDAIEAKMRKEDLGGYSLERMRLSNRERRMASSPYAPGYRFGLALEGIGMRQGRMQELRARRAGLAAKGELSPEREFELQSEMESLTTENYQAVASIAEGVENRLPALSAGRGARFSRMDSMALAAVNLGRMGHPGRSMGSANGRQLAMQDAFVSDMVGDLDIGPRSRTGAINAGFGPGGTQRMEQLLGGILKAIEGKSGANGLRIGEERGRLRELIGGNDRQVRIEAGGFN